MKRLLALLIQGTQATPMFGDRKSAKRKTLRLKFVAIALVAVLIVKSWEVQAQVIHECSADSDCELLHRPGSECLDFPVSRLETQKKCSNPYLSGCLAHHYTYSKNESTKTFSRSCNGDDISTQHCRNFDLDYSEIRIHNANWESAIFYSWIIQIFLSELLHVPARVGMAEDMPDASFYNPSADMSWSSQAYAFDHIRTANSFGGHCEQTTEPCVHVLPEVWIGQEKAWKEALLEGAIDQLSEDGQVGKISWYIPKFTAERYPDFTTYHGLSGRREELAEIFQTPTSWEEYCTLFSPTSCITPDGVAERLPVVGEEDLFFQSGSYTGYFRRTPESNCTINPDNCTGHIVGAPCGWSTNLEAQAYWNDIALRSAGKEGNNNAYSYRQMIEIWRAANATRSHLAFWWFTPGAIIEEFRGTDFEFQPVLLPEPTSTCRAARIDPQDRCHEDPAVRRGVAQGSCDNEVNALQKVVASSLRDMTLNTPRAERSPGYQAILNLKVSHLSMNNMLRKWVEGGRTGFAARDAVCDWVVEHQAELEGYIPRGYPRVLVYESEYSRPIFKTAMAIGGIAATCVLVCMIFVHRWRRIDVLYHAQLSVSSMILLGLLLVSIASIVQALEPQDEICVSLMWLTTLGYSLKLVPLLVKVAAINRLMLEKGRSKRAYLSSRDLSLKVFPLVLVSTIIMAVWTSMDPSKRVESKELIEAFNTVQLSVSCSSESVYWSVIVLSWEGLFILCATVLAYQSRKVKREFNSRNKLGLLIYSHFVFFILRTVAFNIMQQQHQRTGASMDAASISAVLSYLFSADVFTALAIYMVPKLIAASNGNEIAQVQEEPSSMNLSVEGSSLKESIREVGASSREVKEIVAKAHMAMSEYKESQKSSDYSSSARRKAGSSSLSSFSRRSSSSRIEAAAILEGDEEEKEEEFRINDKESQVVRFA